MPKKEEIEIEDEETDTDSEGKDENIYERDDREKQETGDEISGSEGGFVEGYEEDEEKSMEKKKKKRETEF